MSSWNDPTGCSFEDPVEEEVLACVHGLVRLGECWTTSEYVHVAAEDSSLSDEQERDLR
jgi:hypothetical protein